MKTSALIFLSLLVFSLSSLSGKEANTELPTVSGAEQTVVSEPATVSSRYSDYFALETVQQSAPAPLRVLRKQPERLQRTNPEVLGAFTGQYFTRGLCHDTGAAVSILGGHVVSLSHSADYLKFGILII